SCRRRGRSGARGWSGGHTACTHDRDTREPGRGSHRYGLSRAAARGMSEPSMSAPDGPSLPNVAVLLATVLQQCPQENQPLLIALAERLAAERYRRWSEEPSVARHAQDLRDCAAREESIAAQVEGLYPKAAGIQAALRAQHPDLFEINASLFA